MKNLLLLISLLAFTFSANAQVFNDDESSNDMPSDILSVLDVNGKAKYKAPNTKRFKKVKAGAVLEKSGTLKLKKKTKLSLLSQGNTVNLSGKGKHALNNLPAGEESSGNDEFLAFLSTASGFAGPGGGSQKDTSKNVPSSGHGEGIRLLGEQPAEGKVIAKSTTFKWTDSGAEKYTLKIYPTNSSKAVFSEEVTTSELKVNLANIDALKTNQTYTWQVETTGEGGITRKSEGVDFTLASMDESDKLLRELKDTESYQKSSMWQKRLREVHALKSKGFVTEAKAIYNLIAKQFPKNQLIQGAAALF